MIINYDVIIFLIYIYSLFLQVIYHRSQSREERRRLRLLAEEVEKMKKMTDNMRQDHWTTKSCQPTGERRIKLSIGGMVSIDYVVFLIYLFIYLVSR